MGERTHPDAPGREGTAIDIDHVCEVLAEHPVRLAVLFGSQITEVADPNSDVDIAIEFDDGVDDRGAALMAVLTDLSVALDRNDIDLAVVDDLDPRVGRAAFTHGQLLCGSAERAEAHRRRFEERVDADGTEQSLRDRFDETLDRIDRLVGEG